MKIITGIDFSDTSSQLAKRAALYAKKTNKELFLIHVVIKDRLSRFLHNHPKKKDSDIMAQAEELMKNFTQSLNIDKSIKVSTHIEVGNAAKTICSHISDEKNDLIVVSAHESPKSILGPIASQCIRKSSADVLLVRDWHDNDYKKITVCVDFSKTSFAALQRAIEVASFTKCEAFEIIHVIYPPGKDYYGPALESFSDESDSFEDIVRKRTEERITSFCKPLQQELNTLPVKIKILESEFPSERIVAHLNSTEPDLVIIGTTGQENLFGLTLGSNAERLIHRANCSVLAVKHKAEE